jgi:hypothetical protein
MGDEGMKEAAASLITSVHGTNKKVVEAALGCNEIGARTHAVLARHQFDVVETYLDAGAAQLRVLLEVGNAHDWVARQAALASIFGERLLTVMQDFVELNDQAMAELSLCVEDGIKAVRLPSLTEGSGAAQGLQERTIGA